MKKTGFRVKGSYIIYSIMAAVFIIQSVITVSLLQKQRYDDLRINLSGRQRMLSQKLSKEIILYSQKRITPDEIFESIQVFDLTIRGLCYGGEVPEDLKMKNFRKIPPVEPGPVREELLAINRQWEDFKARSTAYIERRDPDSLIYVINENTNLLIEIDSTVNKMEEESEYRGFLLRLTLFSSIALVISILAFMLVRKIREVRRARRKIIELERMLPICANCKRIRKEDGDPYDQRSWVKLEEFLKKERDITFSHGLCPECAEKLYPGVLKDR